MQEITPGMNASDAPTVDELLLVAEGSVEFLFGTSRAALLQISSPLSTSESKAWLSSQNTEGVEDLRRRLRTAPGNAMLRPAAWATGSYLCAWP